ncbi:MAG: ASKHA domain-containing protein [Pelolinea sp.]|nr:ASKHA domain-containing protein [Pelolinea sp.]
MSFTIEFQPLGIRLVCGEPFTLLEAARQAGISLRSDCGGAGICGKCAVQIFSTPNKYPPTDTEKTFFTETQLADGLRLACETIVENDLKVQVPSGSVIEGQVLQVEGSQDSIQPDPLIFQKMVRLDEANLNNLASDFTRLQQASEIKSLTANLEVLRRIPDLLRKNNWQANLIIREKELVNLTGQSLLKLLGLAVDVGSTKLACYLMNLETGEVLATKGVPNPQIAYGEDIMARLAFAIKGKDEANTLHSLLMQSINQAAAELCAQIGLSSAEITDACLVGNTAMHHFFLNLPAESLAFSPFVPAVSNSLNPLSSEIGLDAMPGSHVYAPAVIAGFVGSDHLAFLLAEGFSENNRVCLGIDIGTNTEIALQNGSRLVSVSTASGPAFEGAHIRFGMRAAPGAIEHVSIDQQGKAQIQVIGGQSPTGICGSGILDAVSEMRRLGILNHRGRMDKSAPGIRLDDQGKPYFILAESDRQITLSQNDIDQILLAKGAIRAGIDVLMDYLKVKPEEIQEVLIAGAFGSYMRPEHAMRIGMLPEIPLGRVRAVGNAAGAGARMMLISKTIREKAEKLAKRVEYLELTVYPEFSMFYARGIQA